MRSAATQPGRFATLLDADPAVVAAKPGRIASDACRLAWDDRTIAVFLPADGSNFTLGVDQAFVMRVARVSRDGASHVRVELSDGNEHSVALSAPAPADSVAGLPVDGALAGAQGVDLDVLADLVASALAMGARVAVSAAHADELRQGLPPVSLAAQVAERVALEPERPELDPSLSLEEVAARAAAAERERLRRMEERRAAAARPGASTARSDDARTTIARLEARIDVLEAELRLARQPGRVLDVPCPSCDAFGRETPLRLAPVARPERARGLAAMCERCGWLGVVVVSRAAE